MSVTETFHDNDGKNTGDIGVVVLGDIVSTILILWTPNREGNPRTNDGFEATIIASSDDPMKRLQFFVYGGFDRQLIVFEVLADFDNQRG